MLRLLTRLPERQAGEAGETAWLVPTESNFRCRYQCGLLLFEDTKTYTFNIGALGKFQLRGVTVNNAAAGFGGQITHCVPVCVPTGARDEVPKRAKQGVGRNGSTLSLLSSQWKPSSRCAMVGWLGVALRSKIVVGWVRDWDRGVVSTSVS